MLLGEGLRSPSAFLVCFVFSPFHLGEITVRKVTYRICSVIKCPLNLKKGIIIKPSLGIL